GGTVVAEGSFADVLKSEDSLTAAYMSGRRQIPVPETRRKGSGKTLTVKGARANNLKNVDAAFPLGTLTCVTGVSGGGKSSLVLETLYKALAKHLYGSREIPGPHDKIDGLNHLDKVIDIDQSPIG